MKKALRQEVRADLGELLRPKTLENTGVLTVTGLVPSPVEVTPPAETAEPPVTSASATAPAAERERIVQDIVHRVRYLLTLKGRPPFRLAGVETYERLLEVKRCVAQLVRHDPESRLVQVLQGLRRALKVMRRDYTEMRQAADWLEQLSAILDPDGKPARSGAEVQAEWRAYLDQIVEESQAAPHLLEFGAKIVKVSQSYAPGLFHTYDVPREACRALTTTGRVNSAM